MKYPLAVVVWEDSVGCGDQWVDFDEIVDTKLSIHTATGWLVYETEEAVYICQSYDEINKNYGAVQVIAKSAILDIELPFTSTILIENTGV